MKKKTIFGTTAVLCVLACILCIGNALKIGYEYRQGEKEYSELADIMVSPTDSSLYISESAGGASPINVNFDMLSSLNANVVGWLYCEGTPISYPVVQSTDNSYYLNRLYDDRTNSSGAIFMDAMNSPDLSDVNTIIYGHNMKNGTMFASLQNYDEQWYYEQHPVMYYLTKNHDYKIDVFASYETTGDSDAFTMFFDSAQTYQTYLENRWSQSRIDTSWLPMSIEDNIVTLSTCSYGFDNARYVVQGKVTQLN